MSRRQKLVAFRDKAIASCESLGHKMSKFAEHDVDGVRFYRATCQKCYKHVDIHLCPRMNASEVKGEAIESNCNTDLSVCPTCDTQMKPVGLGDCNGYECPKCHKQVPEIASFKLSNPD